MSSITVDADRLREIGERYGVARLEVFGSVGRGDEHSDSDLDLLYVLKPGTRLGFAFFQLEDELTELFGCHVDLVARDAVNEYIRPQILHDARLFYAA
jgi:predicted nucleotidyltransferase